MIRINNIYDKNTFRTYVHLIGTGKLSLIAILTQQINISTELPWSERRLDSLSSLTLSVVNRL